MAATVPAQDLNNGKWSAYKSAQFGGLVLTQRWLLACCIVLVLALGGVGYEVYRNSRAISEFKPIVVRINDVGKAEVVYLRDFDYRPEAPEVKRGLTDFVEKYYTHTKARLSDYYLSKYYLSREQGIKSWTLDEQTGWIKKVIAGQIPSNEVIVRRVTILNLKQPPYGATVEFTKIFYSDEQTESKREEYTATIQFVIADKIDNRTVQYNPLGMIVTDFHADQAFH